MIRTPDTRIGSRLTWQEIEQRARQEETDRRSRAGTSRAYQTTHDDRDGERAGRDLYRRHL